MRALSLCSMVLLSSTAFAQAKPAPKEAAPKDAMKAQMDAVDKAHAPGPVHQWLKTNLVGSWTIQGKIFTAADKVSTRTGTAEVKPIFGDRFLVEDWTSTGIGHGAVSGQVWIGYDNMRKHATLAEIDSAGSTLTVLAGTVDEPKKTITFTGPMWSNMQGHEVKARLVLRVDSDKKHTLEMYFAGPDGKEQKRFENVYTKKP